MQNLTQWWNSLTPPSQMLLHVAAAVLVAWVLGKAIGGAVKGLLVRWGIDEHLRLPWTQPQPQQRDWSQLQAQSRQRLAPSDAAGHLCAVTVWLGAGCSLAAMYRFPGVAETIYSFIGALWTLAAVTGIAMVISGWLARAAIGTIQNPVIKERLDTLFPVLDSRPERFSEAVARLAGTLAYSVVFLLALLAALESLRLTAAAGALSALWHLGLRLFSAAMALGIGWLGVKWAGEQPLTPGLSAERADLARLGIIAGTVLLAIALLTGGAGILVGLAVLVLIAVFLLPLRDHVPDIWAGIYLRFHPVQEVSLEETPSQVRQVGLLMTGLSRNGSDFSLRNREVLAAVLKNRRAPPAPEVAESGENEAVEQSRNAL